MSKNGFFGRIWQDSRRSMPSTSVGPLSATPTLPVFSENARARKSSESVPVVPPVSQSEKAQSIWHSVAKQQQPKPAAVARADGLPNTLVYEFLRFERVRNVSRINVGVLKPSSSLSRPGQSTELNAIKPNEASTPGKAESAPGQARELPWGSPRPGQGPSDPPPSADNASVVQQSDATIESAARQTGAPVTAVEQGDFVASEPATKAPVEATPSAPAANQNQQRGTSPTVQADSEGLQPPSLHIGEVRIRLVEAPKEASSPRRSSLTPTESDSRRLLRSL